MQFTNTLSLAASTLHSHMNQDLHCFETEDLTEYINDLVWKDGVGCTVRVR